MNLPSFDAHLASLDHFINGLVQKYRSREIKSWDDLEKRVKTYFSPERMDQMEAMLPGWQKMASYSDGITLVHVSCVFLGLFMLPEFQGLTAAQQQMAKWIVLFHDLAKFHIRGKKDTMHAFHSAIQAARLLPKFGFPTTGKYQEIIDSWSEYTAGAFIAEEGMAMPQPDNQKLADILTGIDLLFGSNTPAALIVKTVLLHISLDVDPEYPTPAPLAESEIKRYIDSGLLHFLKVMMLADNEGWVLFDPDDRKKKYDNAVIEFRELERLIAVTQPSL